MYYSTRDGLSYEGSDPVIIHIIFSVIGLIVIIALIFLYASDYNELNKVNSGQISKQEYCQKYKGSNTKNTPNICLEYFINPNK